MIYILEQKADGDYEDIIKWYKKVNIEDLMDTLMLLGKMQMKKLNNTGDKALYRMHLTGNYSVHQFL